MTKFVKKKQAIVNLDFALSIILASIVTITFSGFNRPIWGDEYLHFSLAGLPWSEIFQVIQETNSNENHGQTWFHQILSISLLKIFGAGTIGLRLISWIATFVTLIASLNLLKLFSVTWALKLAFLSTVILFTPIAFEMGNSRSYILVIMSTALISLGLFSTIPLGRAKTLYKLVFAAGVVIGSVSHPYFPVILCALVFGAIIVNQHISKESVTWTLRKLRFFMVFSILGVFLSVVVGLFTWLRGGPEFPEFDPFQWLPIGEQVFVFSTIMFIALAVVSSFLFFKARHPVFKARHPVFSDPVFAVGYILIITGIGLSLFFSWVSFIRNYWILPRQWLPGVLIFFIGGIILLAFFVPKFKAKKSTSLLTPIGYAASIAVFVSGIFVGIQEVNRNVEFWVDLTSQSLIYTTGKGIAFFEAAGNLNIQCGGPVWPEHSKIYNAKVTDELLIFEFEKRYSMCSNKIIDN